MIVSDGSTDRTDEIVMQYLQNNPWIELVRMPEHRDRHFCSQGDTALMQDTKSSKIWIMILSGILMPIFLLTKIILSFC